MEQDKRKRLPKWFYADELMEKWSVNEYELADMVNHHGLRPFHPDTRIQKEHEIDISSRPIYRLSASELGWYIFNSVDVERLEEEYPELTLAKEKVISDHFLSSELDKKNEEGNSKQNHEIANGQKERYLFLKEGPSWTIKYERQTLRGLKGKGFEIIHYLVCRAREVLLIPDLVKEFDGIDLGLSTQLIDVDPKKEKEEDSKRIAGREIIDSRDLIYGKSMEELKDHYCYLKNELNEAENNYDLERREKAEKELDDFTRYMTPYLAKGGKSRQFSDELSKATNRIGKRIERALATIKKEDEDTWRHFYNALRPIRSYFHSYNPDRNMDWLTE